MGAADAPRAHARARTWGRFAPVPPSRGYGAAFDEPITHLPGAGQLHGSVPDVPLAHQHLLELARTATMVIVPMGGPWQAAP